MTRSLNRLLNPKSIALFGGAWAENVIIQLQQSGYAGEIWPVHPTRKSICGLDCFASIDALPAPPDASFIGVNRELSIEIVRQLSAIGAGGATCFASGFLESETELTGGADLQEQLIKAAGKMPILGPNCYGFLNYLDNATLWPDQHAGRSVESGVALIGQSSNVLINMTMQKRALPISHVVAAGNQAQTQLSDIADYLLKDSRVSAIGLYIEGFGDIRKLEAMAAKAQTLGKPIVAIKTGKSEKSRAATLTHTASLAGSASAASALMKRLGIIEVDSIAVFLETLKLLHVCGPLKSNAISSMSCSGGEAGLIADMAQQSQIDFRSFTATQYDELKKVLGPLVSVNNPLDYHTFIWSDEEKLTTCYQAVLKDNFDLNILIMDLPHDTRCDAQAWQGPLRAFIKAKQTTNTNAALLATLPENLNEDLCDKLIAQGIVPFNGMEEMIFAVDAAIRAGDFTKTPRSPVCISDKSTTNKTVMDEATSKNELENFGLKFPKRVTELSRVASELKFPVALKGLGISHKSDAGAVALNITSLEELHSCVEEMSGISDFLVEEMVEAPLAELLIGITRDTTGIYLLSLGAGGVLAELLNDTASLIIPSSREEISTALNGLRISKLLSGYRGKPAADFEAILDSIEAVQAYCIANPQLIELDINPLMALTDKAIAVDALIIKEADDDRTH